MTSEAVIVDPIICFAANLDLGDPADIRLTTLSGGVSSDVWRADGPRGTACIKRPLPMLRVATPWEVSVQRGEFEARWLETAYGIVPSSVPRRLGYDPLAHLIGMEYFPPEAFPNWRTLLLDRQIDQRVATQLGHVVGTIHAATADEPYIAERFDSGTLFDALRLDPYFRSLRTRHPDLVDRLTQIINQTATTQRVLVHGDVSPKNVLVGNNGPILLDAECAWYGDPAFDVAFLCTHLLLKSRALPVYSRSLHASLSCYITAYESHITWEPTDTLRERSAQLLCAMLLARVDGKSPVDYLSTSDQDWVRVFARRAVLYPHKSPLSVLETWRAHMSVADG